MLATGARHALGPVLDIARDPRWGRIEETYGEDPYLAAEIGAAYIRGIQGPSLAEGVVATGKHLVGHGLAEGGLNQAPAHVGPRELRDEQLFAFEAAVRGGGLASVMPAYCDVDGVPCHASEELLTTILRDEWGFDGIVASDYVGIQMLSTQHRLTTTWRRPRRWRSERASIWICRPSPPTASPSCVRSSKGSWTTPFLMPPSAASCE